MFWKNFVELCNQREITPSFVVNAIGVANGSITKWKNGAMPRDTTLKKIADYFGVSVDYLLGKCEQENRPIGAVVKRGEMLMNENALKKSAIAAVTTTNNKVEEKLEKLRTCIKEACKCMQEVVESCENDRERLAAYLMISTMFEEFKLTEKDA